MSEIPSAEHVPSVDDWRGLIVLAPDCEQEFTFTDSQRLATALSMSATCLKDVVVEMPPVSDNLLISFYMPAGPRQPAIHDSLASVCLASRSSGLRADFAAMQLAPHFDVEVFGPDHLASTECYVEEAHELYRNFDVAYDYLHEA
jgi:hypothetical protein